MSYTLSEALGSGSITWTQTAGSADAGSPHVQALTAGELGSGAHSSITLTNDPTLVDGAVYTVSFDGVDLAGNVATTVSSTSVSYDTGAPVFSATAPASSSFVNDSSGELHAV